MKLLVLLAAYLGFVQCQTKFVFPDTSSVDVLVQTASKTVVDFSPAVELLQTDLDFTLNTSIQTELNNLHIPLEAAAKLNATLADIVATASDIEKLIGSNRANCTKNATKAASELNSNGITIISACVKRLTDLDKTIAELKAIQIELNSFIENTTLTSLKSCVPKSSTWFNFFDTLKIKKCLSSAVTLYKNFVSEKTAVVGSIKESLDDLNTNGLTRINNCINTFSTSSKTSTEGITNTLIKCADIIPQFLANATQAIGNVNSSVALPVKKNLDRVYTLTNESLLLLPSLVSNATNKLKSLQQDIADAIYNLAPYNPEKFVDEQVLKGNIFATVESQILEQTFAAIDGQSSLHIEASSLLEKFYQISSQATAAKLQDCLVGNKTSNAIVDCLTGKSVAYSDGIKEIAALVASLSTRYEQHSDQIQNTLKFIADKLQKLSITSKDTAEFIYDKSGINVTTLVKDKLDLLLSPSKNTILSQIDSKFDLLEKEYSKIETFIQRVKEYVPSRVQSTGQPIREAIELLAIIDPSKDYGFLYNKSLRIVHEAESKVYSVIDTALVQKTESLYAAVSLLNDGYLSRLNTDNSSGYACSVDNLYFTCITKCLKGISENATLFFQETIVKVDALLGKALELPTSANATINLAVKEIVEVSTNESIKQSGSAFRDSNMTTEEYFNFVNREFKQFNNTLLPELLDMGDTILDNAAKVYDRQLAKLETARPKINSIVEKVNTAVDDVILIYPSAPINNKTIVSLANSAFERIYKTFTTVTSPASNLTEVANALKAQVREVFYSVSQGPLKTQCYNVYPVLEDAITCLSKKLNNMTAEVNRLTETLYAVNNDAQNIRNDARETLNENVTAEIEKLEKDALSTAMSYYQHYSVNRDVIYNKVLQLIRNAINPIQRNLQNNINYMKTMTTQLSSKEEKAKYEINRDLTASTAFLNNAINAIRYQGNPKLLGNQSEIYTSLMENNTKIIEPYMPKYKSEIAYYTDLFNNQTTEYNNLLQFSSAENINATCSNITELYIYSKCARKINDEFSEKIQNLYRTTTQTQSNASSFLTNVDTTLKDLLSGIVANMVNYNTNYSKRIAEQLYVTGGFSVESIFRIGINTNNRTYYSVFPSIQKLAEDNQKIVSSIKKVNFKNVYPIQANLDEEVSSITNAFKLAIAMSDGLTMENEGAKAQALADEILLKYKNFTDTLVAKAADLGNKSAVEYAVAQSYEQTATMKYLEEACPVQGSKYPISDANVCSNSVTYGNGVNTRNKLSLITSYNSELVSLNNTAVSSAAEYGAKLYGDFLAYSKPVIDRLYLLAGF